MCSQQSKHSVLDITDTNSKTTWYWYRKEFSGIAHFIPTIHYKLWHFSVMTGHTLDALSHIKSPAYIIVKHNKTIKKLLCQ